MKLDSILVIIDGLIVNCRSLTHLDLLFIEIICFHVDL